MFVSKRTYQLNFLRLTTLYDIHTIYTYLGCERIVWFTGSSLVSHCKYHTKHDLYIYNLNMVILVITVWSKWMDNSGVDVNVFTMQYHMYDFKPCWWYITWHSTSVNLNMCIGLRNILCYFIIVTVTVTVIVIVIVIFIVIVIVIVIVTIIIIWQR